MREIRILMVEDNEGDVILAKEALKEAKIMNSVDVASDGEAALDFLFRRGAFANAQTPDLIFLDINIPKINGLEVLKIIKADEKLRIIPVVMLTSSNADGDVLEAYSSYVNCYVTKPVDLKTFMEVISEIENFWLTIVRLPDKE